MITQLQQQQAAQPRSSAHADFVRRVAEQLGGNDGAAQVMVANSRVTRSLIRVGDVNEVKRLQRDTRIEARVIAEVEKLATAKADVPDYGERAATGRVCSLMLRLSHLLLQPDLETLAQIEKEVAKCLPAAQQ